MVSQHDGGTASIDSRVEEALKRCADWSKTGHHRKVLHEVERMLTLTGSESVLEAELLIWKAQALLAMGMAERALPIASRSWDLQASPHACHLLANSLAGMGDIEEAEGLLRLGWELFPDAAHIPIQLTMVLADQGRVPEALDVLNDLVIEPETEDMEVFLAGLHANLLAASARWDEAEDRIELAFERYPDSPLLSESLATIERARFRSEAEQALVQSWTRSLDPMEDVAEEVDYAISRCASMLELPRLVELAAQRLWRSFYAAQGVRPQSPDSWAIAVLLVIEEFDGRKRTTAEFSRTTQSSPHTVGAARRRVRSFLNRMNSRIAQRSFAALSNPRLEEAEPVEPIESKGSRVLSFKSSDDSRGEA
ncbi:MAG: hypothetical protein GY906_34520 [bacterium]|nr:hypothetical protein [bacterium]